MTGVATVVLLNGVGSAGKSSIATALRRMARRPMLHVQMDAFLDMLPDAYWDHPDGMVFEPSLLDGRPRVEIRCGPLVERLLAGLRGSVAAMAAEGLDLIVDDVAEADAVADYERRLAPYRLRKVAVRASLAVLEARESARGDRMPGLARAQFERIHVGVAYDLALDTDVATPEACAAAIARAFDL